MIDLTANNNSYHVEFVYSEANDALVFEEEYCIYSQSNKHFYVKGSIGESGLLPNSDADNNKILCKLIEHDMLLININTHSNRHRYDPLPIHPSERCV